MNINEYVRHHTNCFSSKAEDTPLVKKPVDMYFFWVSFQNDPTADEFIKLTQEFKGDFCEVDPLDGKEHNYIELGGWIGSQEAALRYMSLGHHLGLWQVMTPAALFDVTDPAQKALADQMAGMGMISILP